ncbi:MAG: hypothetical protein AAGD09_03575 [Cyanobacteria bacterium P01_F01_bin.56]
MSHDLGMATLTFNSARLNRKLSTALQTSVEQYDAQFRDAIEANVYAWPRETFRSNGRRVTTPRDIVDTGTLRGSQRYQVDGLKAFFVWDAVDPETGLSYASDVFYGFTNGSGLEMPGRDWIAYAFGQNDPVETFRRALRNA